MKKISTPLSNLETSMCDSQVKQLPAAAPRRSTLDFLRKFARCYSAQPAVSIPTLRGAVMN